MSTLDIKLLWRDWRGEQLSLIISALVMAVMVVTAVSMLADRVERGLAEQMSSFLAADMAVQGGQEIQPELISEAASLGLETANVAFFRSMVFAGEQNHLASMKAVNEHYPLKGQLQVTEHLNPSELELVSHGPAPGEVWVEPRLLSLLGVQLGDEIEIGYINLPITRIISNEPDRGLGFSMTGARVMMHEQDLVAAQLIRPGSRITRRLLIAGQTGLLQKYKDWYQALEASDKNLKTHFRLRTAQESEQELADAMQRGRSFLLLSGTIGVLLAGLAMALASQRYALRLTDQVALMKAWGQSANAIRRSQLFRLLLITAIATLLGIALGWLAHNVLLGAAEGLFGAKLPLPGWRPWVVASITGFVCVLGFALPALWHLPATPPLKVLRRDIPQSLVGQGSRLLIGVLALLGLTWWYSQSLLMASVFLGALFALFAICCLLALQVLKIVKSFGSWQGSYIRLGLANLWRRRTQTLIQLIGFSVTLMLLLVTIGMRTNLISEWQAQLPEDAPTHFLLNVNSDELSGVKSVLDEHQVNAEHWYPMVRGRLTKLNGEELSEQRLIETDGLAREVNFTQTDTLPSDNAIISGQWWNEFDKAGGNDEKHYFSMELEVATELGISIGDEIEFSIGGLPLIAELASIRSVNWQTMQANFYIIFSPGALDRFSPNWMSSVRSKFVPDQNSLFHQQAPFIASLLQTYPRALVLELGEVVKRIRGVIDRVTLGLEMILLLVLACGALVLFAAIGVSYDERLRENAVLRTLGSSRKIITGALLVEFAVLGAVGGVIAGAGAELVLYLVQTRLFNLDPSWHWQLWGLGIAAGVIAIVTLGLFRSREIIFVPPLKSLRQVA